MYLPKRIAASLPPGAGLLIGLVGGTVWAASEGRLNPSGLFQIGAIAFMGGVTSAWLVLPNIVAAAVANYIRDAGRGVFAAVFAAVLAATIFLEASILDSFLKTMGGFALEWELIAMAAGDLSICLIAAYWFGRKHA